MHYVYVLLSDTDGRFYLGCTSDLRERVAQHNRGMNASTRGREWRLVYYEAYVSRSAAMTRERRLKHDGRVRQALMARVKASLSE